MTGRVLPFDGAPHHPAQVLLPWYVNGTLDADERAQVEAHLADCAACRHEAQSLRAFGAAYARDGAGAADAETALARLSERLDAAVDTPEASDTDARAIGPGSPRGGLQREGAAPGASVQGRAARRPPRRFLSSVERAAPWASIAGVVMLGLVMLLRTGASDEPRYRTLGTGDSAPANAARMAVVFDENVSEGRLRGIVQAIGARIVDGPTATGAYVLETPRSAQRDALSALRTTSGVRVAEPLDYSP